MLGLFPWEILKHLDSGLVSFYYINPWVYNKFDNFPGYSRSKLGLSDPERGCFLTEYGVEVLNCPEGFIYKFEELPACSIKHELCLGESISNFIISHLNMNFD